ncbi:sulfocyanin-like copper-binding protein [Argonema antarcticum]|uniref:sulfocyanin-like copper-binding protein n=1 Tax=Argonema antarcticum TaxID=2942763 RepID=UPI0020131321|nr:sulfocyanin-like copper-binding protein [Argonema antarcticum]MCL1474099.1 copper-binding protein [Argonema antarcticum A004/B2]
MVRLIGSIYKLWRHWWMLLALIVCFGFIFASPAEASLIGNPVTEVKIDLGNAGNELKFFPNNLKFVADKPYKLIVNNPSPQKHYFTAKDFADAIWTQKVQDGKMEVKGAIHEIEIKPGAQAEWVFVPLKSGTYSLRCPIAGHTEAGMTGQIAISAE